MSVDSAARSSASTNAPDITVSELSGALKRTVEDAFGHVRVRGEISGYRGPHSSGHVYFSLKDANARIDAVIWKGVFGRLRFKPQDGLEVVATGKVSTFPGQSKYQIVIEALEPAGVGALMALLEERRKKLAAEGLFDPARKQLLPYLPEVIGVVTSPTGAVIRDILHRLSDRFPRHVLVWPVRVQGETSAAEVAAAIRGFNALAPGGALPRPDILIVARGGGSIEDLWGFNEEIVVRAAAESDIPLISAVGHETDWTLIDLAADMRAPTPTGAAEMAVPVRADLMANVHDLAGRHRGALRRFVEGLKTELRSAIRALPQASALLSTPRQRLDLAGQNLPLFLRRRLRDTELRVSRLGGRLAARSPQALLAARRAKFEALRDRPAEAAARAIADKQRQLSVFGDRLARAISGRAAIEKRRLQTEQTKLTSIENRLKRALSRAQENRGAKLATLSQLLDSLSYRKVLDRGYAVVRDGGGHPLTRASSVAAGSALSLEFADGKVAATAEGSPPAKPARAPKPAGPTQGDLF
ncbi:exodeoxyribonuclease VII large subunit [Terrarubrum flagellatum]|uniref:exodeoxyribonuclease VII large subunit n=1 Tax=Terrirubrum flagellatum TaxID=2895980 RepID=UPI0031453132